MKLVSLKCETATEYNARMLYLQGMALSLGDKINTAQKKVLYETSQAQAAAPPPAAASEPEP